MLIFQNYVVETLGSHSWTEIPVRIIYQISKGTLWSFGENILMPKQT